MVLVSDGPVVWVGVGVGDSKGVRMTDDDGKGVKVNVDNGKGVL